MLFRGSFLPNRMLAGLITWWAILVEPRTVKIGRGCAAKKKPQRPLINVLMEVEAVEGRSGIEKDDSERKRDRRRQSRLNLFSSCSCLFTLCLLVRSAQARLNADFEGCGHLSSRFESYHGSSQG